MPGGDDDGGNLIEGQEGRKLTSSLPSIFHFMLRKVRAFGLEHQQTVARKLSMGGGCVKMMMIVMIMWDYHVSADSILLMMI